MAGIITSINITDVRLDRATLQWQTIEAIFPPKVSVSTISNAVQTKILAAGDPFVAYDTSTQEYTAQPSQHSVTVSYVPINPTLGTDVVYYEIDSSDPLNPGTPVPVAGSLVVPVPVMSMSAVTVTPTTASVDVDLNWLGTVYVDYAVSPGALGRRVVSEDSYHHSLDIEMLEESTTYDYTIAAVLMDGTVLVVGAGSFTTSSTGFIPIAPANVWVVSKSDHRVISWDFVTESRDGSPITPRYEVYRSSRPNGTDLVKVADVDVDVNLFVDFVLRGDIFYYTVNAKLGTLVGDSSSIVTDMGYPNIQDGRGEEFTPVFGTMDVAKYNQGRFGV